MKLRAYLLRKELMFSLATQGAGTVKVLIFLEILAAGSAALAVPYLNPMKEKKELFH